ncbi:MAG: hypothetical protein ABWY52_07095 [Candidatus Limnocylindrales bacterium]
MTDETIDLDALVAAAATGHGVAVVPTDGAVTYQVGEIVVVLVEGGTAEFRLRADIAAAAARTPDAGPSPRGPEWVAFSPKAFDRFTRDRIDAWFEFAVRQVWEA